jgi:hypothetical protein
MTPKQIFEIQLKLSGQDILNHLNNETTKDIFNIVNRMSIAVKQCDEDEKLVLVILKSRKIKTLLNNLIVSGEDDRIDKQILPIFEKLESIHKLANTFDKKKIKKIECKIENSIKMINEYDANIKQQIADDIDAKTKKSFG